MRLPLVNLCNQGRLNIGKLSNSVGTACVFLAFGVLFSQSLSIANIRYVGDVDPTGDDAGRGVAGSVIRVGGTGEGGIFVDFNISLDNPPTFAPRPLITEGGLLGGTLPIDTNGLGRVEITDNRWILSDINPIGIPDLIVGNAGEGLLDLFTSAVVDVGHPVMADPNDPGLFIPDPAFPGGAGSMVVGNLATGQGQVTINTIASRILTGPLTVGEAGVGSIDVNFTGSMVSTDTILGNMPGSQGTVTLNDDSRWDLRGPLTVGGPASPTANGFVHINDQALLQSDDSLSSTNGSVTINPQGQLNFAGGTLRQVGTSFVFNNGLIRGNTVSGGSRGDGFIDATLVIGPTGELRNGAGLANDREYMLVSGGVLVGGDSDAVFDSGIDGLIESQGGEMEFLSSVTNRGVIVARDAIMRFQAGLTLQGLLVLGEDSSIFGSITSAAPGCSPIPGDPDLCSRIEVLTGTTAQTFGDVIFSSSPLVAALGEGELAAMTSPSNGISMVVGDDPSLLTISGELTLTDSTILELDYSSAVPSQPGNSFQVISANNISGSFANSRTVADGRYWDIDILGNDVVVTASSDLFSPTSGDFDGNGEVDGFDFLTWQRGYGSIYGSNDLANWEANYGTAPLVGAVAAVPEPSTLLLTLTAMGLCRRRSKA